MEAVEKRVVTMTARMNDRADEPRITAAPKVSSSVRRGSTSMTMATFTVVRMANEVARYKLGQK